MTVLLDMMNDIRSMDAGGVPRAEIARRLKVTLARSGVTASRRRICRILRETMDCWNGTDHPPNDPRQFYTMK